MAYDADLAERIRDLLAAEPELTERKMFGGLAFLLDGHMAVAASGSGGILARVDPDEVDHLLATTDASQTEMGGRTMTGWLDVPAASLRTERQLQSWLDRGTEIAKSLPPKSPKK